MSYTPGPWHCSSFREVGADPKMNGIDIGSDDNLTIGLVCYNRDELTPQECKANARLIAAAPELMEALQEALRYVSPPLNEYDMSAEAMTHGKCRAILARIKGEA